MDAIQRSVCRRFALLLLLTFALLVPRLSNAKPGPLQALERALDHGQYAEVPRLAQALPGALRSAGEALAGEALLRQGRYVECETLLDATLARDDHAFSARAVLGRLYALTGREDLATAVWNRFFDDYEQGTLDKKNAHDLRLVAEAAAGLLAWQDANDTFRDAVNADPNGVDGAHANLAWAALFLEKYDAAHAEVSINEALRVLPDDAEAHALYGWVKLEQSYDVPAAEAEARRALTVNPHCAGALHLLATTLLDSGDPAAALALSARALAVNPNDWRAHAITAAVHLLADDHPGYEAERAKVVQVNPHASRFFHEVAEFFVRAHRYPEAGMLEREAIEADGTDVVAEAALGSNLLRMGDENEGLDHLRHAWQHDHYNVRSYNLLNLYEEILPGAYDMVDGRTSPLRFRLPKAEEARLRPPLEALVGREWPELVRRYGFTPKGPLTLELFTDPRHYAVRTVGLPGLEALGVTFGRVVTGLAPNGKFNWNMMVWHELAHIFALQLSAYRVPRWFTEGLSEWETAKANPTWTRRTHAELARALYDGTLLPLSRLDLGFQRARDTAHIVVAYHEAAEAVAFFIARFGFPAVVECLRQYAKGATSAVVLPRVTGMSLDALDAAFRQELGVKLARYKGTVFIRSSDFSDTETLDAQGAAHPDDGRVAGLRAEAALAHGQGARAEQILARPLASPSPDPMVLLAAVDVALAHKDRAAAERKLRAMLAGGMDGYDVRLRLGQIALVAARDAKPSPAPMLVSEAETELRAAQALDPDRPEPSIFLLKLWGDAPGQQTLAQKELQTLATVDVMDASWCERLVALDVAHGQWQDALTAADAGLAIQLDSVTLSLARAHALAALGKKDLAKAAIAAVHTFSELTDPQRSELTRVEKLISQIDRH